MTYQTIVADPPWEYGQKLASPKARGGVHYPTMTEAELSGLNVAQWAAPDCQLWLWSTNAHLHTAFHVMEAWGFRYVTMATWVKTQIGLGYWLRGQTEHVLLGIKGNPRSKLTGPHGATGQGASTLIVAPRGKHSEKPNAFYDLAETMSEPPRLELFARVQRLGWTCWGDELGIELGTKGG